MLVMFADDGAPIKDLPQPASCANRAGKRFDHGPLERVTTDLPSVSSERRIVIFSVAVFGPQAELRRLAVRR